MIISAIDQIRKALTDLIKYLHNSNRKLVQVTLSGDVLAEERFYVLGFVGAEVIKIERECWFAVLTSEQIDFLSEHFSESHNRG